VIFDREWPKFITISLQEDELDGEYATELEANTDAAEGAIERGETVAICKVVRIVRPSKSIEEVIP
jgi:hypothetical protein